MTIIDFYTKLSQLLTRTREKYYDTDEAEDILNKLLEEAKDSNLEVDINPDILNFSNLIRLDDERSYDDYDYSSSLEDDIDSDESDNYQSSYDSDSSYNGEY